jgi:histidyl-tRNA synthetase
MQKPNTPKGTRDFSSEVVFKRNYITQTIKTHFEQFGFAPIETPSFENLSTLTGKYGDEGDQLIFKILNSGDYLKKADAKALEEKNSKSLTASISEKALRYDLTVPFSRYVAQHQNELTFPFKRYQIQPVWRADRPQKGRFREFYQCDADVIGSDSLWQEIEFILLYDSIFTDLKLPSEIHLNNRKILSGLAEIANISEQLIDFTVALDKLDKIGEEKVKEEMLQKRISPEAIDKLTPLFSINGSFDEQLEQLKSILADSEIGLSGIEELSFIQSKIEKTGLKSVELKLNLTLARGLDYYTGTIFEVKAKDIALGSIGGGGRYDDLTGVFGLKNMSGVGISFGLDRIYLALEETDLFPEQTNKHTQVLFTNFGEKEALYALGIIQNLRGNNFKVELYPDSVKLKKQMQYADKKSIPFVVLIGDNELEKNEITIKCLSSGEQSSIKKEAISSFLNNHINL